MADLDFKHNVQQIPATPLPEATKRTVGTEIGRTPDIQGATSAYAANTNWMSELGATVAAKSSNAFAARIGSELGKNPQGEIGPSFTEFDKALEQSYKAQAGSTLGLQAQTLISKTNLELAAMPRLDAGTIAKSQQKVVQGLSKIFSFAPDSIRPELEHQYGSVMIAQNEHLTNRMIVEQREDRRNNFELSAKVANQNAYSLGLTGVDLDKNGDSKPGLSIIKTVEQQAAAALDMRDITPETKKVAIDSARQSYLSGKTIRIGLQKQKEGKLGEFEKDLADNPEKYGIGPDDHNTVMNNFMAYMNNQKALRAEDESLKSQEMHNRIATDPTSITGAEWTAFENSVSPLKASQMQFNLIQALKSKNDEGMNVANLLQHYGDAVAQANASPKVQNAAFNKNVENTMQKNPMITRDQAEVQVGMSAGAEVPVLTKSLKNKLWSGDPVQMDSAARQINEFKELKAGHALSGLNDQDLGLYAQYEALRNPADPTIGAKLAIDNSQNQDPGVKKVIDTKWQNIVDNNTRLAKVDVDDWILTKFGFSTQNKTTGFFGRKQFDSPFMSTVYASDIMNKYKAFFNSTRGNENLATQMTQEYVDANYGQTEVNGSKQWTLHPIEKTIGFQGSDGIPAIHKDILRQMTEPMAKLKEAYDKKESNEYWSIEAPSNKNKPMKLVQHRRSEVGTTTKEYDMLLIGSNFDSWDVNVQTDHGPQNLFLNAPMLGVMTYTPDRDWIKDEYMGKSHTFPNEKYSGMLEQMMNVKLGE